jgi:hypothetical protein
MRHQQAMTIAMSALQSALAASRVRTRFGLEEITSGKRCFLDLSRLPEKPFHAEQQRARRVERAQSDISAHPSSWPRADQSPFV